MRRLYEVKVYDGDPDSPETKVVTETVVAWNEVDAMRRCSGRACAAPPVALHYVTWEDDSGGLYRIDDTAGPTGDEVEPTVSPPDDFEDPFSDRGEMAKAEKRAKSKKGK